MRINLTRIFLKSPRVWLAWGEHLKIHPFIETQRWLCDYSLHYWRHTGFVRECLRCGRLQRLVTGVWKWNRGKPRWSYRYGFHYWRDGKVSSEWRDFRYRDESRFKVDRLIDGD